MPERLEEIRFPVTTADAEGRATLRLDDATLQLSFVDMKGDAQRIDFLGVAGLRWSLETHGYRPGLRDDKAYQVLDSDWIRALQNAKAVKASQQLRHLVVGFNEESAFLEVVCETFIHVT
jgi:hypothetical protein